MIIDNEQKVIEGIIIDKIIEEKRSLTYEEIYAFLKARYDSISEKKIEKVLNNVLKKSRIIVATDKGYEIKKTSKEKLEKKHNVVVNFMLRNDFYIALIGGAFAFSTFSVVGYVVSEKNKELRNEQYIKSIIQEDDYTYGIDEVYVVYKNNKAYFCIRKLNDSSNGSYSYYDIKTQNIICDENDNDYSLDNLSDIGLQEILNSNDNKITIDKLEEQIIYNYLKNKEHIKRK